MRRVFVISYLIVLAMTIGLVLSLGVLVAPVIFHSQSIVEDALSHYQQGLLMSAIFIKANIWLMFVAVYVLLYELYDYKQLRRDKWVQIFAFVVIFTIVMFVYYYTPDIIWHQLHFKTDTESFASLHKGSELDFKLLFIALCALLIRRFMMLVKPVK